MNAAADLTDRNHEIIDLAARFGLISAATLQCLMPKSNSELSVDAARKALDRLKDGGQFNRYYLPGGKPYYVLSTSACNRMQLKRTGAALRQRALIRRCLVLYHFAAHPELHLMTAGEVNDSLPDIYRRGSANFYFVDETDTSLGWICLDDGKQSARVHFKTKQVAGKKRLIPQLRELAQQRQFRFLVLTTADDKAAQLRQLFAARPIRDIEVRIAAVTACCDLLISS